MSWDEPIVRSTIKIWNDEEFLSWDRPVSVKKERADAGDEVPKASFLSWDASVSRSMETRKIQSDKGNGNAGVNLDKLTGTINSAIHSPVIGFTSTNSSFRCTPSARTVGFTSRPRP